MKDIIAIGGQGFLKECILYIMSDPNMNFKGFMSLDNFIPDVDNFNKYYLGDLSKYSPSPNDYFVICAGAPNIRKEIYNALKLRNLNITNILYNSKLNPTVKIGDGNVFVNCDITADIEIGNGNLFNNRTMIYHDVRIGDFNCLAPTCQLLGHTKINNESNFGTGVITFPKSKIGNNCKIAAGSVVYKFCKDNCTYMGNPAKKIGEEGK